MHSAIWIARTAVIRIRPHLKSRRCLDGNSALTLQSRPLPTLLVTRSSSGELSSNKDLLLPVDELLNMDKGSSVMEVVSETVMERVYPAAKVDEEELLFSQTTLGEVMEKKKTKGYEWVEESDFVINAIKRMADKQIGSVLVKNNAGRVTGIFTERDYLSKIALQGRSSRQTQVSEVMTSPLYALPTYVKVVPTLKMMTIQRFRHIPLVDGDDQVVGLVSIGDLVKEITEEYRGTIETLREYITKRTY